MADRADESGEALLREADIQAERWVAIARSGVSMALLIAIWLLLAPKDLENSEIATVVGYARISLFILMASGLVGFAILRAGRWRPWMAFWTVTIDSGVVIFNLWLSLRTANLSGDFIAAIPAAVAILVVLVINALRMRPWVQAYATVLLIGATVAVAFHAGHVGTEERKIAAAEIGGAMFGVAPNVARALMITLAGLVLVVAATRGRRLLLRAVRESTLRANLGRYLPAELAPVLAAGRIDALKTGQRNAVGLLFVDIRNSTALEEALDATALGAFIGAFRRHVTRAALTHGGVIDKFIGDGAFLVFGIIDQKPDDAARAILCGKDILAGIARWTLERAAAGEGPVKVGIGVHFGEAFVGAIGDDARLEFTVLGDAVNVAARLEQATKDHGVAMLVSEEALKAAGEDQSRWQALGSVRLRGRTTPVIAYTPLDSAVSPRAVAAALPAE